MAEVLTVKSPLPIAAPRKAFKEHIKKYAYVNLLCQDAFI